MSFSTASRSSSAVSGLSRRSGSLTYPQNSFLDAPSSRKMNMATSMGGKRYFSDNFIIEVPFIHSFSILLEFCFTR